MSAHADRKPDWPDGSARERQERPNGVPMADHILSVAAELFSERGYHAVGIRELADAVGLSTSTLYHYYPTKREILFAIIERFLQQFSEQLLSGLRDRDQPPGLRLERAVIQHVVMTVSRRQELLVGSPVLNALSADQQARIADLRRQYRDAVRDVIAEGVDSGDLHAPDPLLTAMAILDMLDGIRSWYHPGHRLPLETLAERYRDLAMSLCK